MGRLEEGGELFDNDVVGVGRLEGREGRCAVANEAVATTLGYGAASELEGVPVVERHLAPELIEPFRRELEARSVVSWREARVLDTEGRSRYCRLWARARADGGVSLLLLEVTGEREAVEAARQAERRFRALLEGGLVGLALSVDERVVLCNEAFAEMFGYTREELAGFPIAELATPSSVSRVMHNVRAGYEAPYEAEGLRKDGTRFPALLHGRSATVDGLPARVTSVMDLTERRRQEAENRKLQERMLDAQKLESLALLAGGIAHDFNNLLAAIRGNAELVRTRLDEHPVRSNLDAIERAAARASDMTKQLLAYSGRGRIHFERMDLHELVQDTTELLEVSIAKGAELRIDLSDEPAIVQGDATQLQQILINMVVNASDALADGSGRIEVSAAVLTPPAFEAVVGDASSLGDEAVRLRVQDDGTGMDERTLARIFDPFFSTKVSGHGLGLAAVLGIVRDHGGALTVRSRRGEGTVFDVWLPRLSGDRAEVVPEAGSAERLRGRGTVLVADDERPLRTMFRAMLEDLGFEVIEVTDGEACLGALRERPDLVAAVVDMTMPRMSGLSVLEAMESTGLSTPLILCSGYQDPAELERYRHRKLEFLHKPFGLEDLERALQGLVER